MSLSAAMIWNIFICYIRYYDLIHYEIKIYSFFDIQMQRKILLGKGTSTRIFRCKFLFKDFFGWIFFQLRAESPQNPNFIHAAVISSIRGIFDFCSPIIDLFTDEEETDLSIVLFSNPKPVNEFFLTNLDRSFADESFTDSSSCS